MKPLPALVVGILLTVPAAAEEPPGYAVPILNPVQAENLKRRLQEKDDEIAGLRAYSEKLLADFRLLKADLERVERERAAAASQASQATVCQAEFIGAAAEDAEIRQLRVAVSALRSENERLRAAVGQRGSSSRHEEELAQVLDESARLKQERDALDEEAKRLRAEAQKAQVMQQALIEGHEQRLEELERRQLELEASQSQSPTTNPSDASSGPPAEPPPSLQVSTSIPAR